MTFRSGQRVKLDGLFGGAFVRVVERLEIARDGRYVVQFGCRVEDSAGRRFIISESMLHATDIEWKPGDVVVVTYGPGRGFAPYTYVRGAETWPVDKGRTPKTDEWMNRMYAQGKVTPVLQAGGAKFDAARLPDGRPTTAQAFAQGGVVSSPAPRAGSFVWHNDGQMP